MKRGQESPSPPAVPSVTACTALYVGGVAIRVAVQWPLCSAIGFSVLSLAGFHFLAKCIYVVTSCFENESLPAKVLVYLKKHSVCELIRELINFLSLFLKSFSKYPQFLFSRWEDGLYILCCFNNCHSINSSSIYYNSASLSKKVNNGLPLFPIH